MFSTQLRRPDVRIREVCDLSGYCINVESGPSRKGLGMDRTTDQCVMRYIGQHSVVALDVEAFAQHRSVCIATPRL